MEPYLLQIFGAFSIGIVVGVFITLLINKIRSGSVSPTKVKQEYQDYQEKVEAHFEETSKKFKNMTEQYQDLYQHLSVGATSLCRADSVAAGLVDQGDAVEKLEKHDSIDQSASDPVADSQQAQVSDADSTEPNGSDTDTDPQVSDSVEAQSAQQEETQSNDEQTGSAEQKSDGEPAEKTEPAEKK